MKVSIHTKVLWRVNALQIWGKDIESFLLLLNYDKHNCNLEIKKSSVDHRIKSHQ